MTKTDYEAIFRKLHPRSMPWSPWGRQLELRDLDEAEQEKFKRTVDAIHDGDPHHAQPR